MKRYAMLTAVLMLGAAACDDDSPTQQNPNTQPIVFRATLTTGNEVPPLANASEANCSGTSTMTFNVPRDSGTGAVTGAGTVDFSYTITGCPNNTVITLAHIHRGAAGASGGFVVNTDLSAATAVTLANGTGTITATGKAISQALAEEIVANPAGFYFNAHSSLNGAGVVRGQLVRQ